MKVKNNKKLLIFSAHPDDNLSCAGTALFLKDKGFEISEAVFTAGEKGGNLTPNPDKSLPDIRKAELNKASKILGTKKLYSLGQPDSNITRCPELLDKVIAIVRREMPTIVISENPKDYHFDHRQVGLIVTEAVARAGWGISPELGKKYKTPVGLYMGSLIENERTDILVDITKYWDKKLQIMKEYGSQLGSAAYDFEEGKSKYFGFYIRAEYAESFEIMSNYAINLNEVFETMRE